VTFRGTNCHMLAPAPLHSQNRPWFCLYLSLTFHYSPAKRNDTEDYGICPLAWYVVSYLLFNDGSVSGLAFFTAGVYFSVLFFLDNVLLCTVATALLMQYYWINSKFLCQ